VQQETREQPVPSESQGLLGLLESPDLSVLPACLGSTAVMGSMESEDQPDQPESPARPGLLERPDLLVPPGPSEQRALLVLLETPESPDLSVQRVLSGLPESLESQDLPACPGSMERTAPTASEVRQDPPG